MTNTLSLKPLWFLCAVAVAWNIFLYTLPAHDTSWNFLFNAWYALFYVYGLLVGIIAVRRLGMGNGVGRGLLFLGLGTGAYALGTYIWVYHNLVLKVEVPYPSLADAGFLLLNPFLVIGVWQLIKFMRGPATMSHIYQALLSAVLIGLVVLGFIATPDILRSLPLAERIINVLYPLGDAVLLALALIIVRAKAFGHGMLIFASGLVLQTLADFIFSNQVARDAYWNGGIADSAWALAGFLFALGMVKLYNGLAQPQPSVASGDLRNA